ncbi:hypothetical protein PCE1_001216 [Barthelona sp. PCE]
MSKRELKPFENVFISVAGLIGAGKSTLCTELSKVMNGKAFYEPLEEENPYLELFYADIPKYSFPMQIALLTRRFAQHQHIIWSSSMKTGFYINDRSIYEDSVFAKMLRDSGAMSELDYNTYCELFTQMSNFMRKPNVLVYLDVTPEESMERIRARSRDCETGISLEYLQNLHKAYEEFIEDISFAIPVIRVRWDKFRDASETAKAIKDQYEQIANVRVAVFDQEEE